MIYHVHNGFAKPSFKTCFCGHGHYATLHTMRWLRVIIGAADGSIAGGSTALHVQMWNRLANVKNRMAINTGTTRLKSRRIMFFRSGVI